MSKEKLLTLSDEAEEIVLSYAEETVQLNLVN